MDPQRVVLGLLRLSLTATIAVGGALGAVHAAAPEEQRTFVSVALNGEPQADVMVVLVDRDVWIPLDYVHELALDVPTGRQRTIDGRVHVSLASLGPALTFRFDEAAVSLTLSVTADAIARRGVYALDRARPAGIQRSRNSSVFFNYAATAQQQTSGAYAGELGISLRGALLSGSVSSYGRQLLRGPLRATVDHESRLMRVEVGDTVATSGALGDGIDLAGVSVGRLFEIDPYYVSQAPLRVRGSAATPSTAEVYVNGQLVRRVAVAPGAFELTGLTAPIGAGRTEVVVRDAFGREQQFRSSFYQPLGLLQPGLHQFRYAIGVPRLDVTRQWDYGSDPVASGEHRYGLGSRMTLGGRFEASRSLQAGGPALAVALPIGELEAEASASRINGAVGLSGLFGYRYQARRFSLGVVGIGADRDYATLASTLFTRRRNRLATQAFAGAVLGRINLTATHITSRDWDDNRLERVDLIGGLRLADRLTLMITGSRNRFGGPRYEGFAALNFALGSKTMASLTAAQDSDRDVGPGVTLQRSLGRGPGYGYQVQWNERAGSARFAAATLQHAVGRLELRQNGFDSGGASATLSGAVVGVGGRLFATRPVTDAFALVRVPDTPRVRVYSSNQLIGRTNRRGDLIVPDIVSYYGNDVAIDPVDLPLMLNLARSNVLVAPSFRAGGLALFNVTTMNPVVGRVIIVIGPESTAVPAHADLYAAGGPGLRSPIGTDGAFFFDTLPPGPTKLVGRYRGRSFTCDVRVPPVTEALMRDLGLVRCVLEEDDSSPGVARVPRVTP